VNGKEDLSISGEAEMLTGRLLCRSDFFNELTRLQNRFPILIVLSRNNHRFQSFYPRNPFIQHLLQFQLVLYKQH
jgi:hypothetical protein